MCVACGPEIMTVVAMAADAACYVMTAARLAILRDKALDMAGELDKAEAQATPTALAYRLADVLTDSLRAAEAREAIQAMPEGGAGSDAVEDQRRLNADPYRLVEFADGWAVVDNRCRGFWRVTVSTRDYAEALRWCATWNAGGGA